MLQRVALRVHEIRSGRDREDVRQGAQQVHVAARLSAAAAREASRVRTLGAGREHRQRAARPDRQGTFQLHMNALLCRCMVTDPYANVQ